MTSRSVRRWRTAAVGVVAAATAAGALATAAHASAATSTVVTIHQSVNRSPLDYLSSRVPNEGAPAYSLLATRFQYQAWDFPAGGEPAGFHRIYRGYNPGTGHHFVTTDPTGGGLGPVQFPLGWLADTEQVARAHSTGSCAGKTSPMAELRNTRSDKGGFGPFVVTGSDDHKAFASGDVVAGLGFLPCRRLVQ